MIRLADARIGEKPAKEELARFAGRCRAPRLRTMREFAEQEIVIPNGPFAGRRFSCERQPYTQLWFDSVDSERWSRFVATGPTQSGKTLACFVIPLLYHLFEIGETVVCGLPQMDMADDKWRLDIDPVLERTRYRDLRPTKGSGSRGGKVESIQFRNGATLKFMSGGGDDKSRSAFTSRVVVITETDGMDESGEASREADKIKQLIARTRAYGDRARVYMECTVSIESGRTWQEYTSGTRSRIVLPCPHCGAWVTLERDNLLGWQDAETEIDARESTSFFCSACGEKWSEEHRRIANERGKLLHEGQSIEADGSIVGSPKKTRTLGFRWSAVNNLFWGSGAIGADEWLAAREENEENAKREMQQFVWAWPYVPDITAIIPLEARAVAGRVSRRSRGVFPSDHSILTVGVDIGKHWVHWAAIAWKMDATGSVIDYGKISSPGAELPIETAIQQTLSALKRDFFRGWLHHGNPPKIPDQIWVDSGYEASVLYEFCRSEGSPFQACKGFGALQRKDSSYSSPSANAQGIRFRGENYHIKYIRDKRIELAEINGDYWKTWLHNRLETPLETPGSVSLYDAPLKDHLDFASHITAEKEVEEYERNRGIVRRWISVRRNNHWLDCCYLASVAAHFMGVRVVQPEDEEGQEIIEPTNWFEQQKKQGGRR